MGIRGGMTAEEKVFNEAVGNQIRHWRKKRGISQKVLAGRVDVGPGQLYWYEMGGSRCPPLRLRLISEALAVPLDNLIPQKS
jgi:transcriptional regulator with XRE-family HTH domain